MDNERRKKKEEEANMGKRKQTANPMEILAF